MQNLTFEIGAFDKQRSHCSFCIPIFANHRAEAHERHSVSLLYIMNSSLQYRPTVSWSCVGSTRPQ